jgi:hypothetical protein
VDAAVGAALARILKKMFLADRIRVARDVVILEVARRRGGGEVAFRHGLSVEVLRQSRQKFASVVGANALVPGVGNRGVRELVVAVPEELHRLGDHVVLAERLDLAPDVPEVGLDLVCLRGAYAGQMGEDRLGERGVAAPVADPGDDEYADGAHADQHHEQLRLDGEATHRGTILGVCGISGGAAATREPPVFAARTIPAHRPRGIRWWAVAARAMRDPPPSIPKDWMQWEGS